jgi:hypothetical protein
MLPPHDPAKKADGRPRPPSDKYAPLFMSGQRSTGFEAPIEATRRSDRSGRIAAELKRALFFCLILVVVGFVIFEFLSAI